MQSVEDDDTDSPGDAVPLDSKIVKAGVCQVTGHSVVMSFTMHNRHQSANTLHPAMGISTSSGVITISLYDCNFDVLMQLTGLRLVNIHDTVLDNVGIVVIWAILYHRLFLRSLVNEDGVWTRNCSNLQDRLSISLTHYKRLNVWMWIKVSQSPFLRTGLCAHDYYNKLEYSNKLEAHPLRAFLWQH